MLKSKICSDCKKEKAASEFHKDRSAETGLCVYCKPCARTRKKEAYDRKKGAAPTEGNTSLAFLLEIKKTTKLGWTLEQAKCLIDILGAATAKGPAINLTELVKNPKIGKSASGCLAMVKELREAAEKGMDLEAYWKAGRPFQKKAVVYVKGKKSAQ